MKVRTIRSKAKECICCDLKYTHNFNILGILAIKMPSDDEFDYMSDNFLAEWYVLHEINSNM
jgi:hypothetical protein